jgi:hypothetical protein
MLASPWIGRLLFVAALLSIPFPYQVIDKGRVPAAWLATVAGFVLTSVVSQGGEISAIIGRWLAIQAAVAIVLAYAAARLATAVIRRRVPVERQWRASVFVAAGALTAACFPIFATTAVGGGVPMNLFRLFAGG